MKNPKRVAPTAIIDNLAVIGDRQKHETQAQTTHRFFVGKPLEATGCDYVSVLKFLTSYDGSTATFNAYRRELERLLQWSWHVRKASIHQLTRDDIVEFISFCINPPVTWIGVKNVARFIVCDGVRIPNSEWRPFVVQHCL